jgi:exodeoxyribonuclease VII large subunit
MNSISLYDLNKQIGSVLKTSLLAGVWVHAEINSINVQRVGHCYIELIEKDEITGSIVAKSRANIWSNIYKSISAYFLAETGKTLSAGMKVAFCVDVTFHEVYGISLNVVDIDPTYTLGESARKKAQVIKKLEEDGIIDMNKMLSIKPLCKNVAVISAEGAAGYGDFCHQLEHNAYGYKYNLILFNSIMQGEKAEASILESLDKVLERLSEFDVLVMIRGGGAVSDLDCFDSYNLSASIAQFPLPVLTGIGHTRDVSVVDMVANMPLKTPTAVADFLINHTRSLEEKIDSYIELLSRSVTMLLDKQARKLDQCLTLLPLYANRLLDKKLHALELMERSLELMSPESILKKGYAIVEKQGRSASAASLSPGDEVKITLVDGVVGAVVKGFS